MAQAYVKVKGTLVPLTSAKQHCHVWIGTKLELKWLWHLVKQ